MTMLARNGHDWAQRFPRLADATRALPVDDGAIDGEAVVLEEHGVSHA